MSACLPWIVATSMGCKRCSADVASVKAQSSDVLFAMRFGDGKDQKAWAVAAGKDGTSVIVGGFAGTLDLGGGPLLSAGQDDVFVAKLDAKGEHVWSRRFGDAGDQTAEAVAIDAKGNVLVVGAFSGAIDFGGGQLASTAGTDAFFVVFDPHGKHRWSQAAGSSSTSEGADGAAFDGSGNILVTGYAEGAVDLGGPVAPPEGERSLFVAKWDESGKHLWSKRIGDPDEQVGFAVAADAAGNVLVTGRFEGDVDFGGGRLHAGLREAFVAKYDPRGEHVFSRRFGDSSGVGVAEGRAITADRSGNVLVTGSFSVALETGAAKLVGKGDTDLFVLALDPKGGNAWIKSFGDAMFQEGLGIAVNAQNEIVIAGGFGGTIDFGDVRVTGDDHDGFVAMLDSAGKALRARRFGGRGDQNCIGLAVDESGGPVIAGSFGGDIDFGGVHLTSAGMHDAFVVKLPRDFAHD